MRPSLTIKLREVLDKTCADLFQICRCFYAQSPQQQARWQPFMLTPICTTWERWNQDTLNKEPQNPFQQSWRGSIWAQNGCLSADNKSRPLICLSDPKYEIFNNGCFPSWQDTRMHCRLMLIFNLDIVFWLHLQLEPLFEVSWQNHLLVRILRSWRIHMATKTGPDLPQTEHPPTDWTTSSAFKKSAERQELFSAWVCY